MEQNMKPQADFLSPNVVGCAASDEVDLVQLWLILMKRKYLIVGICFVCLLGGTAFVFLTPDQYTYTSSIEIGTTLVSNGSGVVGRVIESPEAVLAKIYESYAPLAIAQMMDLDAEGTFQVEVKNPKKSNLIILSSKGPLEMAESYQRLHDLVTQPLMADHGRILDVPRRGYQLAAQKEGIKLKALEDPRLFVVKEKGLLIQLEAAKMELISFDDQKQLLLSREKRLAETQQLLRQQITEVEENLAQTHASRAQATANVGSNEAQAMTLLMITNQIERNERRLSELRERLNINLENQKQVLQKNVAQNRRDWELQKKQIAKLQSQMIELKAMRESEQATQKNVVSTIENKIATLQETRKLGVVVRSVTPTGSRKSIVLVVSVLLGLVGGVMFAFCVEFISSAQRRMEITVK